MSLLRPAVLGTAAVTLLTAALGAATPGQTIRLAPGTYHGAFLGRTRATASAPITVTGPPTAILTNPDSSGTNPAARSRQTASIPVTASGCTAPRTGD
jgi:hypothetical protein